MSPQKVAVITPGSFMIPSGWSSSVERVVEKMAPLSAGRLDIRVFGRIGEGFPPKSWLGSVPCYRVPGGESYLPSILRHLRVWRPDTVDVHNRPLLACRLKRKMPQTRVLLTLHSTSFIRPGNLSSARAEHTLNLLDGIVVNSSYLKSELNRRFPALLPPVFVNHLGCSLEDFLPRWTPLGEALRKARLASLGWQNRRVVLYIGRLLPRKGVHHLLDALPSIIQQDRNALLVIVGSAHYGGGAETGYMRRLREAASRYPDHAVFLPYTPYPQVSDWYNLADVAVVPSLDDEAFGLVNVEAMAAGVPVIATRVGGIPEIIKEGYTGLLLPPEELPSKLGATISALLQNEELRRQMGLAGREEVRTRFRWNHTAERWVQIVVKGTSPELAVKAAREERLNA
ncbi:glycosyltransferase family 1 protein [Paenibacillus sp. CAA11]|uniref:glycosyltransferase family 4 protein n=1 Tax=Paenibacillus sp. CAA11 TaxID=1532905 RepID=UPI000D3CE848|nr:glycosyltransferase family 4 protein [Paenibacillus sp. CAA11]AWB45820.1 glycosyltransferase family 1 protein [Paenibacillus sp. CAA11]